MKYVFYLIGLFHLVGQTHGYKIILFHDTLITEIKPLWIESLDHLMRDSLRRYPFLDHVRVSIPNPIRQTLNDKKIVGALILSRCQRADSLRLHLERHSRLESKQILTFAAELCSGDQSKAIPVKWAYSNFMGFREKLEQWVQSVAALALQEHLLFNKKLALLNSRHEKELPCKYPVSKNDYVAVDSLKFAIRYLKGRHLNLATIEYPPIQQFVKDKQGNVVEYTGFTFRILNALADYYQFEYSIVVPADKKLGSVENGTWNGAVGMAAREEVDFVAADMAMTYARSTVVDYLHVLTQTVVVILVPPPRFKDKSMATIEPFQRDVWLALIASLLCCGVALWVYSLTAWRLQFLVMTNDRPASRPDFREQTFFFFRVVTCQASDYLSELHAARLLIIAFIAMSVILVNSYNSELVSFITVPKLVPVVDSMEDLAERYPISLIAQKFSASELVLFGAEQGVYKKLGDRIRNKPEQFVDSQDEGIDKVLTEKHGYFGGETIFQFYIARDYAKYKRCRFTLIYDKHELFKVTESFPIPKGSPLREALSMKFMSLSEFGIVRLLYLRELGSVQNIPCFSKQNSLAVSKSLSAKDLLSAFVILAIGFLVTFIAFIGELVFWRWCKSISL